MQDADPEYDLQEYPRLIKPIVDRQTDIVLGSRFTGGDAHQVVSFRHMVGNKFLTLFSNMLTNLNLADMETCYKVFCREVLLKITTGKDRIGFEPEIIAKIARRRVLIEGTGISDPRPHEEGNKNGWRNGLRALRAIVKYNVFR